MPKMEPPGQNCANGGQRIDIGVDLTAMGALEDVEIKKTAYVCNGPNRTNAPLDAGSDSGRDAAPPDASLIQTDTIEFDCDPPAQTDAELVWVIGNERIAAGACPIKLPVPDQPIVTLSTFAFENGVAVAQTFVTFKPINAETVDITSSVWTAL
jgi:hypothetical protein